MNDLIVYLANVINRVELPSSVEKTDASIVQASHAYDILRSYRGHPDILMEALEAFLATNSLPSFWGGAALVMIEGSMLHAGNYDRDGLVIAQDYIQKARELDAENFYAEYANSIIHSINKNLSAQRFALDKVGKLTEAQTSCYYARSEANYYWKTNNDQKFREWRDKAQKLVRNDKQRVVIQFNLASDLMSEGLLHEAILSFQKVEKLCQNDPWYFLEVASLYMYINQLDNAETYIKLSLQLMDFGMARMREAEIKKRRSWVYQLKRFLTGNKIG